MCLPSAGTRLVSEVAEATGPADGGEAIADLAALRGVPELFGPVASDATAWRVLDGIHADALVRLWVARAAVR